MNRSLIVPGIIMVVGGLCMLGGLGLLVFRLADPETAASLLPGTPSPIPPTEASLFETPLAPPPRLQNEADIPIMPVMAVAGLDFPVTPATDIPTPTDTLTPTLLPSATASKTLSPTPTSSPTQSIETLVANQMATAGTPLAPTPIPFVTPTPSQTPTPSPTFTASPTPTPTPTRLPRNPARLLIPSINLDAEIKPVSLERVKIGSQIYSQWEVLNGGLVGWHETSAPLGQPGNTVLNGHHNVYGHVFRDLVKVQVGDPIRVEASDGTGLNYTVVQTMILLEEGQPLEARLENARWLLPSNDERITLVTCWPPNGRSYRLVVVALPTDQVEAAK